MDLALTAADARRIVAGGRLAVFLGIEAGFDNEGDLDVLRAVYRLGVTCTCAGAPGLSGRTRQHDQTLFRGWLIALDDLPDRSNGVDDRRSGWVGREGRQRLQRAAAIRLRADRPEWRASPLRRTCCSTALARSFA
jgi:hypothetical protein